MKRHRSHKGEDANMLTLDKFEEAAKKVKEVTTPTPLVYSDYLSASAAAESI